MRIYSVPQKFNIFNTFNTFNTFDPFISTPIQVARKVRLAGEPFSSVRSRHVTAATVVPLSCVSPRSS
jgi:hypothetical protein